MRVHVKMYKNLKILNINTAHPRVYNITVEAYNPMSMCKTSKNFIVRHSEENLISRVISIIWWLSASKVIKDAFEFILFPQDNNVCTQDNN